MRTSRSSARCYNRVTMAYGQNSWRGKLERSVENQVHKYFLENVQLTFAFISIDYHHTVQFIVYAF